MGGMTSRANERPILLWAGAPWLAVVLLAGGCSSPTDSTGQAVSETFAGTLTAGGIAAFGVTTAATGTLTLTLSAFAPQSTITMGLGIGQPASDGSCGFLSVVENAKVGSAVSGTADPGLYCIAIYDLGNMQATDTFTLTVTHF